MPSDIDYDDTDDLIAASIEIDNYDFQDSGDADDRVSLVLYQAPDGRFFRYVLDVGINSAWEGALNELTWFGDQRPDDWTSK